MKRVLYTGASGFIGRNVCPYLKDKCELFTPGRNDLNLLDEKSVIEYIKDNKIEIIIHAANPNYVRSDKDSKDKEFEDRIRIFSNLMNASEHYEYMYNLGSGAEFNKQYDICMVKEEDFGKTIPYDSYGLAKYVMHKMIENSSKICNLRVFAIYGPTDHESKFITHCIDSCLAKQKITIRQDCYFDYLYVMDFAKILEYFIYNIPKYNSYNITTGSRIKLSEIAKIVLELMDSSEGIDILSPGMNKEYTADNQRLIDEIGDFDFTDLREGIMCQIKSKGNII